MPFPSTARVVRTLIGLQLEACFTSAVFVGMPIVMWPVFNQTSEEAEGRFMTLSGHGRVQTGPFSPIAETDLPFACGVWMLAKYLSN